MLPRHSKTLTFHLSSRLSVLTAHLNALFRTLQALELPLDQLVARANRIFCETMLSGHFATLVCGRASAAGSIELANAGHCAPLLLGAGQAKPLEATGLPLGVFATAKYGIRRIELAPGDSLLFYTDGFTEACNAAGVEYGTQRFARLVAAHGELPPEELTRECLADLAAFQGGAVEAGPCDSGDSDKLLEPCQSPIEGTVYG